MNSVVSLVIHTSIVPCPTTLCIRNGRKFFNSSFVCCVECADLIGRPPALRASRTPFVQSVLRVLLGLR